MALKTPKEYVDSLRKLKLNLYLLGERVDNWVDNPIIRPSLNAIAVTYKLALEPESADLAATTSIFNKQKINRFNSTFMNVEDLVKKVKMQREMGQRTACCFQRCVGMDAISATYEIDQKYGTDYHKRFRAWLQYIQENDLCVCGAMTDVKGQRGITLIYGRQSCDARKLEGGGIDAGNYNFGGQEALTILANVCKHNVTRFPYELTRLAEDIAGVILVTTPSEKDFRHPVLGKYVDKYLGADWDTKTWPRKD